MINTVAPIKLTVTFLVFYTLSGCLSVILNILEIHLIRKSWKTATNFEFILLHLAIADLLTGLINVVKCVFSAYVYAVKFYSYSLISIASLLVVIPTTCSTVFVIVIGIERLMAIKSPLKHRYHSSSRRQTICLVAGTWIVAIIITTLMVLGGTIWLRKLTLLGSVSTTFTLSIAIVLTVGMCFTFILYSWIGHLLLRRNSLLFKFDSEDSTTKTKSLISAIQKERASIMVCTLVVVSYIALNMPVTVDLFHGRLTGVSVVLTSMNSAVDPVIYFLKGYIEKYLVKRKDNYVIAELKRADEEKASKDTVVGLEENIANENEKRKIVCSGEPEA